MSPKEFLTFRFLLFCHAVLIVQSATGQKNYFSTKTITTSDKNFSFPVFYNGKNPLAAEKINQFLQLSELELLNGHEKTTPFEIVANNTDGLYGGKTDISFELINNSSKLLSIAFDESSCGMTCAYWLRYYNFNSLNGDLILIEDLFTPEGFKKFKPLIIKKRMDSLISQLESDSLSMDPGFKGEFLEEKATSIENDDLSDFFIKDNSLFIDGENLLSKNEKFSGIDMTCRFQLDEFKLYLNDYGKAILMNTATPLPSFRSTHLPQLYTGTIGNEKILLIIRPTYEKKLDGIYTYIKNGIGINMEGSLNGKALYLKELTRDYKENGSIDAEYTWKQINGTWTNKDGSKIFTIKITRK